MKYFRPYLDEIAVETFMEGLVEFAPGVDRHLRSGGAVCEFGFGDGSLMRGLHRQYPDAYFYGVDPQPTDMARLECDLLGACMLLDRGRIVDRPFQRNSLPVVITTKLYCDVVCRQNEVRETLESIFDMMLAGAIYILAFEWFITSMDGMTEVEFFELCESVGFSVLRRNAAFGVLQKPKDV